MDDILRDKCKEILNDATQSEEDKFEAIDTLVSNELGDQMGRSDLERVILDLFWEHRQETKPQAKENKVKVNQANQVKQINQTNQVKEINQTNQINQTPKERNPVKQTNKQTNHQTNQQTNHQANQTNHQTNQTNQQTRQHWISLETPQELPDSPFDQLRAILGDICTDQDIERVLSLNDFDIGKTIDMLLASNEPKEVSPAMRALVLDSRDTAKDIVCRYFLQPGGCFRGSDCMYSHDPGFRICRFWLQGNCLASDSCTFLHSVPNEVLEKYSHLVPEPEPPKKVDLRNLPTLGSQRKAAPKKETVKPDLSKVSAVLPNQLAKAIPKSVIEIRKPLHVPWEESSYGSHEQYLELRNSARKLSDLRNKYLQLATDSWASNEPAMAKVFSKKGQQFNEQMVQDHKAARDLLLKQAAEPGTDYMLDLHGLELDESVDLLRSTLLRLEKEEKHRPRCVYAICGRGHYKVKKYADQLTQQVQHFLSTSGYAHRRVVRHPVYGTVIGIDPFSRLV